MDTMLQDIRYAIRSLIRTPVVAMAAITCLALGIGANASIFGVVDMLLFRAPPHVRDADAVARVYLTHSSPVFGTYTTTTTNHPAYQDLRDQASSLAAVAAFHDLRVSVGRGIEAREARSQLVTHEYFPLLGVQPAYGRFFAADEDRQESPIRVAVVSDAFARRLLGSGEAALGKELRIGRGVYTVIGVAPTGFTGVNLERVDIWLPLHSATPELMGRSWLNNRGSFWLHILTRLKAGRARAGAESEATTVYRRGARSRSPEDSTATIALGPIQLARGPTMSQSAKVSTWLAAVAAIVLLVACANVANLLLARSMSRQREIAVRVAIGASRPRLLRLLLAESVLLAIVGGIAALLVTLWTGPLLRSLLLPNAIDPRSAVDPRVALFAAVVAAVASLVAGLPPALQASRPNFTDALKGATTEGRAPLRLRAGLLIAQVALTFVLLAGTGLFVRSLRSVQAIDLGFKADRVLMATMDLAATGVPRAERDALFLKMLERLQALPGVTSAAATVGSPFGWSHGVSVSVPGRDSMPRVPTGGPYYQVVTPDYFAAMGTPLLRGRGLTSADAAGPPVVVINETFARLVWPGDDALGKCIRLGDGPECREIVGVVPEAKRYGVVEAPNLYIYRPMRTGDFGSSDEYANISALLIRPAGRPESMISAVQREMQAVAPDLPFASVVPLADRVAPSMQPWRLGATMFGLFGSLALLLAAVGLYGVLAYSVTRRRKEIGLRIALGARVTHIVQLIAGQGVRLVAIGLGLGLLGALAAGRAIKSLLYGVSSADPMVLLAVAVVLLVVAGLASLIPARRAARVDPMLILRSE